MDIVSFEPEHWRPPWEPVKLDPNPTQRTSRKRHN